MPQRAHPLEIPRGWHRSLGMRKTIGLSGISFDFSWDRSTVKNLTFGLPPSCYLKCITQGILSEAANVRTTSDLNSRKSLEAETPIGKVRLNNNQRPSSRNIYCPQQNLRKSPRYRLCDRRYVPGSEDHECPGNKSGNNCKHHLAHAIVIPLLAYTPMTPISPADLL